MTDMHLQECTMLTKIVFENTRHVQQHRQHHRQRHAIFSAIAKLKCFRYLDLVFAKDHPTKCNLCNRSIQIVMLNHFVNVMKYDNTVPTNADLKHLWHNVDITNMPGFDSCPLHPINFKKGRSNAKNTYESESPHIISSHDSYMVMPQRDFNMLTPFCAATILNIPYVSISNSYYKQSTN